MLLRTALASVLLLLGGWAAASWLTYGFQAWTDEGARRLEVDKATQRLQAFVGEQAVFTTEVSTGKTGYETPTGRFWVGAICLTTTCFDVDGAAPPCIDPIAGAVGSLREKRLATGIPG